MSVSIIVAGVWLMEVQIVERRDSQLNQIDDEDLTAHLTKLGTAFAVQSRYVVTSLSKPKSCATVIADE